MSKILEILKQAILLERRGYSFYKKVAMQSDNPDVKMIFEIMAKEEQVHEQILSTQYKSHIEKGRFSTIQLPKEDDDGIAAMILNDDVKSSIEAAGYEAAAISAAIDMETKAIKIYEEHANLATDKDEIELFTWLANWEKTHHRVLFDLDKDLKERVWNDSRFWPF